MSFVYVYDDGTIGSRTIYIKQETLATVQTTTTTPGRGNVIRTAPGVDDPRVAAPWEWGGYDLTQVQVAYADYSVNSDIRAANYYVNSGGTPVINDVIVNLTDNLNQLAVNSKPVISYAGDFTLVAWTVSGSSAGPPTTPQFDDEVLARRLHYSTGAVVEPDLGYSIVNVSQTGNQNAPSLAGRYTALPGTPKLVSGLSQATYAWYDDTKEDVFYKSSNYGNTALRQAKGPVAANPAQEAKRQAAAAVAAQPLAVYPNPVHGEATIGFVLREGEQAQQLEVFDVLGKRVSAVPVGDLAQMGRAELRWNAAEALHGQTGLYLVRLTTSMGVRSLRVQCK